MKFKDFKYEHLDFEDLKKEYEEKLNRLSSADNADSFMEIFKEINQFRGHIMTMSTLCSIRHTIDTSDEFYDKENEYWDNTSPLLQDLETKFVGICLDCAFKKELPIPETFFMMAENQRKSFDEKIIEDLQEENRLTSEYGKLKASAKIEFEGEIYNLASISSKMETADRDTRKKVYAAINDFYTANEDKFDDIYDRLVKVRDRMAKKLGYSTFTELGYIRMNRFDYDQQMVEKYRSQVVSEIVPIASELYRRQAKRIGLDTLKPYDTGYKFKTGNPTPYADIDTMVNDALKMYTEMSKETGEFFSMMVEQELFDLPTRPNKEMGGYCTDIFDYKVPFIFSNANGTSQDVDTLTHEAGHAFQSYLSQREIDIPDICFPTYESCEIHSMSMEFFAHPWMELFFKNDADKYRYTHIADALFFLPYGCMVDHFQHEVYNHPQMSKEERKATWAKLEKIYHPDHDFSEFPLLDRGGWFYRQGHIFQSPFYYIDYTLAQVCALQFYTRLLKKDENVWNDYLSICRIGGTKSFLGIVEQAGLKSPFEDGCLEETARTMKNVLDGIDDQAF